MIYINTKIFFSYSEIINYKFSTLLSVLMKFVSTLFYIFYALIPNLKLFKLCSN